jgi:hypothetical protein
MNDDFSNSRGLVIDEHIRGFLSEVAKWAKLLSIVGFVGLAFVAIIGVFFGSIFAGLPGAASQEVYAVSGAYSFIYVISGAIYAIPLYYLYSFASCTKLALQNDDQVYLRQAFERLKSHYKFLGIMTLLVLGFYLLIFLGALAFGGFALLNQ